jgi:hypothetical protein
MYRQLQEQWPMIMRAKILKDLLFTTHLVEVIEKNMTIRKIKMMMLEV